MRTPFRVAINTFVQYIQLVLNVLIGLYSVRVILNALGPSDYGIYDLIAGVVSLLNFVSISLSQTSMRFLSVSLGKGDIAETRYTFSTCFWLHLYIAVFLVIMLVVLGLFLFNGFLNIPEERIPIARMLYYFMILSVFLNIITSPFVALITAQERFVFISLVLILDSLCKLGIAIVISSSSADKLLLYGALMVCVTVLNTACYVSFDLFKFRKMISFRFAKAKEMKDVTGFAGWTVLDILGTVANRQGYTILLNTFFGTVINTVFALSRQIEGHMYSISASAINTMKPQIMKSQGAGQKDRVFRLSLTAGKFGFSLMSLVAIPLLVMMPEVLSLWLKEVPEGTALFSRLMITACMGEQLTRGLVFANQAVGDIKWFSISISTLRMMALPISCFFFHLGAPPYVAIVVFLICEFLGSLSRVFILSRISEFQVSSFMKSVLLQLLLPFTVSLVVSYFGHKIFFGILGMLAVCAINAACYILLMALFGLTPEERVSIQSIIDSFIHRNGSRIFKSC